MLKMGNWGEPREPLITAGRKIDRRGKDSDKNREREKKGERKRVSEGAEGGING